MFCVSRVMARSDFLTHCVRHSLRGQPPGLTYLLTPVAQLSSTTLSRLQLQISVTHCYKDSTCPALILRV